MTMRHYQANIKMEVNNKFVVHFNRNDGNLIGAVIDMIQKNLYDNEGQDGNFHVVDAKMSGNKIKTIVIFQIDDTEEYYEDANPLDLLHGTFKCAFGDETKVKYRPMMILDH